MAFEVTMVMPHEGDSREPRRDRDFGRPPAGGASTPGGTLRTGARQGDPACGSPRPIHAVDDRLNRRSQRRARRRAPLSIDDQQRRAAMRAPRKKGRGSRASRPPAASLAPLRRQPRCPSCSVREGQRGCRFPSKSFFLQGLSAAAADPASNSQRRLRSQDCSSPPWSPRRRSRALPRPARPRIGPLH
jgi:hypothetical protein